MSVTRSLSILEDSGYIETSIIGQGNIYVKQKGAHADISGLKTFYAT